MIALSNTIHIYARPDTKEKLLECFTSVLDLEVHEVTKSYLHSPEPMYAVTFANGASLSVEFTEDAASLQQKALEAGLKRVVHPKTPFFYVQAPGGQVFRIVESAAG
jgi:hypothetical protein